MLDKKRIKEAEANVRAYLSEGMLKKQSYLNENVLGTFIRNSKESPNVASILFKNKHSSLWTIVCSYYSMYYMANAVIYSFGYKIGEKISHKVTSDALIIYAKGKLKESLIEEYEDVKEEAMDLAGIKADELVESFDFERRKREKIQYRTTEQIKENKAKTSLERAKRFLFEMEKLIINNGK